MPPNADSGRDIQTLQGIAEDLEMGTYVDWNPRTVAKQLREIASHFDRSEASKHMRWPGGK